MSRVFEVDPANPEAAGPAIEAAEEAIKGGLLVVLPTETVYGIASRPDDPEATARLFEAKRRPGSLTLPVLAPDGLSAWRLGVASDAARALAERFWPGPLTVVLPRTRVTHGWELGDQEGTIGLRVPDHPLVGLLMQRTGPLAATSANRSGQPPVPDAAGLVETFGYDAAVYLVLSGSGRLSGSPSTVVDLSGAEPKVLREGAIGSDRLREVLGGPAGDPTG